MTAPEPGPDRAGEPAGDWLSPGRPAAVPLGVAAAWVGLEFALRRGLGRALAPHLGGPFAADWTLFVVGFPAMAALLSWAALRSGQGPSEWGWAPSLRSVLAGLGGVVALVVVLAATSRVDAALFGLEQADAAFTDAAGDAIRGAPLLAVAFLLGNGVLGPVAEEQVWRGVVQSDLVDAWGPAAGVAATAVLFALKHVVVDLSVVRLTTLLALGVGFGLLRHRYGTVSSTVAHVGLNLLSSASLVALALA